MFPTLAHSIFFTEGSRTASQCCVNYRLANTPTFKEKLATRPSWKLITFGCQNHADYSNHSK